MASWYATSPDAVGNWFTSILAVECREVLGRTWKSERTLIFAHNVLAETLVVRRAREIRARITRRMDLWGRVLHMALVGD